MPSMRVRIYASGYCNFEHIDDDGYMVLPEGATLNDVLSRLGIPRLFRRVLFTAVNYRQAKPDTRLEDGDVVSLLGALSGG